MAKGYWVCCYVRSRVPLLSRHMLPQRGPRFWQPVVAFWLAEALQKRTKRARTSGRY